MSKETELAWAAGFFEGEGSIWYSKGCTRQDGSIGVGAIVMEVGQMTDSYHVERFLEAVGVGKIYCKWQKKRNKDYYVWWCKKGVDVYKAMLLLHPYLSTDCRKRKRYQELIDYKSTEFAEIAKRRENRLCPEIGLLPVL